MKDECPGVAVGANKAGCVPSEQSKALNEGTPKPAFHSSWSKTEKLKGLDLAFYLIDQAGQSQNILGILELESTPDRDYLEELVELKLSSLPELRKIITKDRRWAFKNSESHPSKLTVLETKPLGLSFEKALGLELAKPFKADGELWELILITDSLQPADKNCAAWVVIKLHHCFIDGISGCNLLRFLTEEDSSEPKKNPALKGFRKRLAKQFLGEKPKHSQVTEELRPKQILNSIKAFLSDTSLKSKTRAENLSSNHSKDRDIQLSQFNLKPLTELAKHYGLTQNDLSLGLISSGLYFFERNLCSRSEGTKHFSSKPIIVPFNLRNLGRKEAIGNFLSISSVSLPAASPSPLKEAKSIAAQMKQIKKSGSYRAYELLGHSLKFLPNNLALWLLTKLSKRTSFIVTNLPFSKSKKRLAGAKLRGMYPIPALLPGQALGIGISTYTDKLCLGLSADPAKLENTDALMEAFRHSFDALNKEAEALRDNLKRKVA